MDYDDGQQEVGAWLIFDLQLETHLHLHRNAYQAYQREEINI